MASKIIVLFALLACAAVTTAAPASNNPQDKNKEKLETASSYGLGYGIYDGYSGLGYSPYTAAAIGYPGYGYNLGYGQIGQPAYAGYGHHAGYAGYVPVYNDYAHSNGVAALGYYNGINAGYYQ